MEDGKEKLIIIGGKGGTAIMGNERRDREAIKRGRRGEKKNKDGRKREKKEKGKTEDEENEEKNGGIG